MILNLYRIFKWYGWCCKNIEKYNPNKKRKILFMFDDIIAGMLSNKAVNLIVTELLIRIRKLNISKLNKLNLFSLQSLIFLFQKILD